ncbi:MAG: hypothetical protein PHV97_08190 [Candidatus Omnitrophica bacterium]|nr:hypothetical protein [Candidatus Omnitrophota bacterium]
MKRILCLTIFFVVFSCSLCWAKEADDISVKIAVDKAFLTIGDPVTYTVTVDHAPDIQLLSNIPSPPSDILEIKKVEDIHEKKKNHILTGRKFILTSYRLGEFVLGPITIHYRKAGGPEKTIQTNKLYLTVKSVAEGVTKEDIRDVKTVVPYPWRLGKLLGFLLGFALLLAGYFLYRILRKKKNVFQPAPPPISPEEEALMHLGELYESDLLKRGFIKMYYLRLSEILRIYFEKRYSILAVELTTAEILRALRPRHLDSGLYQKIQSVLEAADLAKFAKWVPTPTEVAPINRKAEEIIKESAPTMAPPLEETSHGV